MRYDLAAMVRRAHNPRRSAIVLRDIVPPATLATDLYRSCYLPVVGRWRLASAGIVAEYERTLSEMTTDSPADIQRQIDAAGSDLERLFLVLQLNLRDWGVKIERWQRGKWRGAVLSATGVDINTMIGPEDMRATVGTYVEWNTALIKDVSDEVRRKISNSVFAGLNQRKPATEVAKEISEATDFARDRSKRIASDQLSKLAASLAAERRREAGITIYKYRHSGKLHPRKWHQERDGKLYADNKRDAGRTVNGHEVNDPLPADDRAGVPPYCGCREQGVIDLS